jgi:tryptophan halogenase
MVESTAKLLAELLPVSVNHIEYPKNKYNVIVQDAWDKVIDFIKLHYILSDRDDSEFWREQTKIETASDRLKQALAYWEFHAPTASDFKTDYDIFKLENYKYILFGMKYFPKNDFINNQPCSIEQKKFFNELNDYKQKKLHKSIGHRAFIESVKNYRMKKL